MKLTAQLFSEVGLALVALGLTWYAMCRALHTFELSGANLHFVLWFGLAGYTISRGISLIPVASFASASRYGVLVVLWAVLAYLYVLRGALI